MAERFNRMILGMGPAEKSSATNCSGRKRIHQARSTILARILTDTLLATVAQFPMFYGGVHRDA